MQPAVRIENLSKLYRIGAAQQAGYRTLRESLMDSFTGPWRRWRDISRSTSHAAASAEASHSTHGHVSSNGDASVSGHAPVNGHSSANGHTSTDAFWALNDVSFDVQHGEVVGIIGRNGAGKSTLLKILSRITEPTKGRVVINGRVASLLEVGTGFHPELTGRENIYLNGAILGMHRHEIKSKFDAIVDFSGIGTFLDTPVKRYSSGMYVRLAFAVAAHMDPEILIIDEVLAVGDAEFQKKCLGKMQDVAKTGRTVLFVSHNMGAISSLCHRAVQLVHGKVRAIGAAEDVVTKYLVSAFQTQDADLHKLRLRGYGEKIRFTELQLLNASNGTIAFGQPIRFEMKLRSDCTLTDLSIGCSIFDIQGQCVGSLQTHDCFSIRSAEQRCLTLTIDNITLAPGNYYAGFSIGQGSWKTVRTDFDIVIGYPDFQVLPVADGEDSVGSGHQVGEESYFKRHN